MARKNAHDPEAIQKWYDMLQEIIIKYGIVPEDISNVDETGFRVGVGRSHKVIISTQNKNKKAYTADPDDRQYITVVECIQAGGSVIPPMIIQQGKNHLERSFPAGLDDTVLCAVSSTGYLNDELALQWLLHYDKFTRNSALGPYRMLIFDGFGAHLMFDFISFCWDNNIIPVCLPPHATHLMQPLDVVCFQPYKHYHSEALNTNTRIGRTEFGVTDFLAELASVRSQTFKSRTICSAFRHTGLVPLSADIVLQKLAAAKLADELREYEVDDDLQEITPEEQAWLDLQVTPTTPRQFELAGKEIDKFLRHSSTGFRRVFGKFGKGAVTAVHAGALAIEELEQVRDAIARKSRRSDTSGGSTSSRYVQKGGVIYVADARHKVAKRQETELEAARRVIARDEAANIRLAVKATERIEKDARKATRALAAVEKRVELERKRFEKQEARRARAEARGLTTTIEQIDPTLR